jgi:hypothetical protein
MSTIAANDRRTETFVADDGQTDFPCDFPILQVGQAIVGVYALRTRGEEETTLNNLDHFETLSPDDAGFIARLYEPALAGDTYVFYGRTPVSRPREFTQTGGFRYDVAEGDARQLYFAYQETRRDVDALLASAELGIGAGGGGVTSWSELENRPDNLTAFADLAGAADKLPYFTGDGAFALTDFKAPARQVLAAASLAAIFALVSPLTTKGDLLAYSNAPGRLPAGANGQVLTADATATFGIKWATPAAGGGAPDWGDLTNIPAKVTSLGGLAGGANKLGYFTGADSMGQTDLTAFGRSLIGSADAAAANTLLGASGGTGPFKSLAGYGAAMDDATDDKAAFDAFIADATNRRAWLEGTAYYVGSATSITRPAMGPGKIHLSSGDYLPAEYCQMNTRPTAGTGSDLNYYFSGDLSRVQVSYYSLGQRTAGGNIRKSLSEPYFESVTTPRFEVMLNSSGWGGYSCKLNGAIAAGATSCVVNSADGIATGDVLGFTSLVAGIPVAQETKTVTVVGTTLSWTGGLANAYPDKTILTHGYRTFSAYRYTELRHNGGGDAYAHVIRCGCDYIPTAGQTHYFETATVGCIGGSLTLTQSGTYGTSEEWNITDGPSGTVDAAAVGFVHSFERYNDTGARGVTWLGMFLKSEGTKPMDVFIEFAGKSRVGLDMARCDFTSNGQAAMQTALGHRWFLNSRYVVGQRGYDATYGGVWAGEKGDMYIGSATDGTSDIIELGFARAVGQDGRIRIRPTGVQINTSLLVASAVNAGTDISLASTGLLVFGAGSGNYLYNAGGNLYWHTQAGNNRLVAAV